MEAENRGPLAGQGIGRRLETAREARGLSLREAEERTRIRARYLRDLERENFDFLPAVYILGSLRTYADYLGLDGAVLSGELKDRLAEPEAPARPSELDVSESGERRPGIFPAIGFDQLFLGAGVIMISILAIMTLVAAAAQEDQSPVSGINEPSTPQTPSGVDLAGIVEDGAVPRPAERAERPEDDGNEQERPRPSGRDDRGDGEGPDGVGDRGDSRPGSIFGDVEFVRMSPSSPSARPAAGASAKPASPGPAETAADRGEFRDPPSNASAVPDRTPQAPPSDASAGPTAGAAPSRKAPRGGAASGPPAGREPRPAFDSEADRISATADRAVDQALSETGIER